MISLRQNDKNARRLASLLSLLISQYSCSEEIPAFSGIQISNLDDSNVDVKKIVMLKLCFLKDFFDHLFCVIGSADMDIC